VAATAALVAALSLTAAPDTAYARGGVGTGAAVGIGLGAFALGSALGAGAYYAPYGSPYGYGYAPAYSYYPPAPAYSYYPPAPAYSYYPPATYYSRRQHRRTPRRRRTMDPLTASRTTNRLTTILSRVGDRQPREECLRVLLDGGSSRITLELDYPGTNR